MKRTKTLKVVFLASFCLLTVSTIVISCRKTQTKEVEQPPQTETFLKRVASTKHSIDQSLKRKIIERFGQVKLRKKETRTIKSNSISSNFIDAMVDNVLFDTPTLTSYEGSDIQATIFEQPSSTPGNTISFVTFQQNGLLGDMAMIVQVEQLTSTQARSSFYDLDYNLVGQFISDQGVVSGFQGFETLPPSTQTLGWWGRWGSCLRNGFNSFTDGNPVHAAAGLICWSWGAPCAVGAALGCAAAATFQ